MSWQAKWVAYLMGLSNAGRTVADTWDHVLCLSIELELPESASVLLKTYEMLDRSCKC